MSKRSVLLSLALVVLLPITAVAQTTRVYTTTLVGANEPDGGDADGFGVGMMTFTGTTLNFLVTQNNLTAITGTHIHRGSSGSIVINFAPTGQSAPTYTNGVATGTVTGISQALIDEIVANPSAFYLNVHSTEKTGGAIRGSLSGGGGTLAGSGGAASTENPGTCTNSVSAMCLNNGRFRVEATWTKPNGETGAGKAVKMTTDTGYFWFFSEQNVEMTVKVLNACSIGTTQWVFASGLTNVQVVLKVTDTQSGTVRTYTNPNGTAFLPIQDTSAFLCP